MAVVVAVALVLTSMTAAFAATTNPQADAIAALKLMQGNDGDMMLENDLARDQAVKIIITLTGKAAEVEALKDADVDAALAGFADAAAAKASWSAKWYAYAIKNGIIEGYTNEDGDKVTDFAGKLYGKQFATMLMKAFGYKDVNYATSVTELSELEGSKVADEKADESLTRADAIAYLFGALTAKNADGKTVVETYVGSDADLLKVAQDAGLIAKPEVVVLGVESVTATNLKEIQVAFNKDVDKDTAEAISNYTLSTSDVVTSAALSGKTVTLTLQAATAQQTNIDVTVKNVKDTSGVVIAETKKSVKMLDVTEPTVTGIEVTGPKQLKVSFSEPITSTNITSTVNFNVDDNKYSVANISTDGNKALLVNLATTLPAGEHTLTINANGGADVIKDFAGFSLVKVPVKFTYNADNVAPTATIEAKQNQVKVIFSKPIDTNKRGNMSVYHTYNKNSSYALSLDSWSDSKTAVYKVVGNQYLPIGTATVYVNSNDDPNFLVDNWGNKFASTSFQVSITADTTKPTVTKVEAKSSNSIDVTFSEEVNKVLAESAGNYTIKDSGGDSVAVLSSIKQGNTNVFRLSTATLNGGSYTITIKGIKDTSIGANEMESFTTTLAVSDLVKPTVTATGAYSTDKKKVVISFSEAMATTGTYSVLEKANYIINGTTALTDDSFKNATISLNPGGKAVTISFENSVATLTSVTVARVADLAGNVTAGFSTVVSLTGDDVKAANFATDKMKVLGTNKVEFEIDQTLNALNANYFELTVGSTTYAAASATYANDSNKAVITVTFAGNPISTLGTLASLNITTPGAITTTLGTTNSLPVTLAGSNFKDYVAPTASTPTATDSNGNGKLDTITINYSEPLYVASVQEADYTVEGYEITGLNVSSSTVTLTVKELGGYDTGATPKVTLVGAISDDSAQRNSLGAKAGVSATDAMRPIIVNAIRDAANNTIILTFSEAVSTTSSAWTAISNASDFVVTGASINAVTHEAGSASVKLTMSNSNAVSIAAISNIYDRAGLLASPSAIGVN